MKYFLRVVVHEPSWERQLEDIVSLCHRAGIEEVLLKEQCHQILMSPFPLEKQARMAAIYKRMGARLRAEGIGFSINLATVVGHCDAKLDARLTLPYTKFVGESLKPNYSTCCILDEGWQILTDLGAAIAGGMGLAAGANLNPEGTFPSMFEPIHGSAPDIAGQGKANPMAAVWSASQLLDHLGYEEHAAQVLGAIEDVLTEGKTLTPDLGGGASTSQVGDALVEKLEARFSR